MKLYSSSYLPIIIVFLQMGNDRSNKLKEAIKNELKEKKKSIY